LLVDLAQRSTDLRAHYTDSGVLPRKAFDLVTWDFAWSLHTLGGSIAFEALLFSAAALCAIGLILGYRTFGATLGCWLLTVSLHARNPFLRDGQDDLARVLLFWCLFLPLGSAASLDARHKRQSRSHTAASAGSIGLVIQIFAMYGTGVASKLTSPWWLSGGGILNALRMGRYVTATGLWLSHAPALPALSFSVVFLEAAGPITWLVARNWRVRTGVVTAFVALHAGMALCLRLGFFPLVCIVAWLFFLPSGFWDWQRMPAPPDAAAPVSPIVSRVLSALAAIGVALVIWCNLLYLLRDYPLPRWPQRVAQFVGLQQYWSVFAPRQSTPFTLSDGWLVIPAVQRSGREIDLESHGRLLDWERPRVISSTFWNARWRHYFANMASLLFPFPRGSKQFETIQSSREAYAQWLCHDWNSRHPADEGISHLSVYLVRYRIDDPDVPAQRELLTQGNCFEADRQMPGRE
jgi:hypothetical protein